MISKKSIEFANEFYIIEKTVELVVTINGEDESLRIEALHNLHNNTYQTRVYIKKAYNIQPTYPQNNGDTKNIEKKSLWVDYDCPWTNRDTADATIEQAIAFLRERYS